MGHLIPLMKMTFMLCYIGADIILMDSLRSWVGVIKGDKLDGCKFLLYGVQGILVPFSQWKWMSFLVSSRSGAVRSAIFAENRFRHVIMPRAVSSSLLLVGVFRFLIASSFAVAGSSPLLVIVWPKKNNGGSLELKLLGV